MTNRRIVALVLALQLLSLLLLTQTWFSISMVVNGNKTVLGDYDGSQSYAISMPTSLLLLAITLVTFLVSTVAIRVLLAISAVIGTALSVWLVALQVSQKNVRELDGQLDRLTGIAKTHGVSGLKIDISAYPWLWLVVMVLTAGISVYLSLRTTGWQKSTSAQPAKDRAKTPVSAIDLWDAQRD